MERRAKIVILGGCGCGKSSVMKKFVSGGFDPSQPTTIGAAFLTKEVERDSQALHLDIWDTAGQERYGAIAPMYYRDAHAVVVVYDITDGASVSVAKKWCAEVRLKNRAALLVVFGNKTDLVLQSGSLAGFAARTFSDPPRASGLSASFGALAEQFREYGAVHLYGSAKTGEGVPHLFKVLAGRTGFEKRMALPAPSWWCF